MSRLSKAAFFGLLIGLAGVVISFFDLAHQIEENAGLGLLFKLRGVRRAPSDVVVVSIDKESSAHLNVSDNPDRWPRLLHARLVEKLAREGAQVITFDLYFIEPRSAEEDNSFAKALRTARNVVLAEHLQAKEVPSTHTGEPFGGAHRIVTVMEPIPSLSQSAVATAPFVLPRIPIRLNTYWTFQTGAGDSPTFPVVAFNLYALSVYDDFVRLLERATPNQARKLPQDAAAAIAAGGVVKLIKEIRGIFKADPLISEKMFKMLEDSDLAKTNGTKYRLLKSLVNLYGGPNRRYLNYYGPPRTLTTVPFYQALQLGEGPAGNKQIDLKGKAVFVGLSEILLRERDDSYHTVFSQANGLFISGVEIAATAFSNLLEDAAVKPISSQYYILTILAWGVLVGVICRATVPIVAALGIGALSILYLLAADYQFKVDSAWYPVVIPLFLQTPVAFFGAVLWSYFETNKERQHIRKALAYYVPNEVVDQLAKNIADIKRGGQTVYGACLFTDAAGYTNLSETMGARELSDFMQKYFEATFEPVKHNGGLVVDVKGDSILAIWKAARPEVALRNQACRAALDIAAAVKHFNQEFKTQKLPTRVGVHAGEIFLNHIGAGEHYRYGPTGDTVNTASRMDGLNKQLGTGILVSEEVIHGTDGFLTREAGSFRLKGKSQPVVVHELLCRLEESEEAQRKTCAIFAEALRAFRQQSWDEAKQKFQSIENCGEDGLSNYYLKLCEQYKKSPPGERWDRVIDLEEK